MAKNQGLQTGEREARQSTELGHSNDTAEVVENKRPPRIPPQKGGTLDIPSHLMQKGYYYYWATDANSGEIERLQSAYYEFVTDERGNKITKPAGNGKLHYLMRLEEQYRQEDLERRRLENNRILQGHASVGADEYTDGTQGRAGEGVALRKQRTV